MEKMCIKIEWTEGSPPKFTYTNISFVSIAVQAIDKCRRDAARHLYRGVPLCPKSLKEA